MRELTRIIEESEDEDEQKQALAQLRRTHGMLDVSVDETVKENAPASGGASAALTEASDALVKARKEVARVAEALQKVAKALGLPAKLFRALARDETPGARKSYR